MEKRFVIWTDDYSSVPEELIVSGPYLVDFLSSFPLVVVDASPSSRRRPSRRRSRPAFPSFRSLFGVHHLFIVIIIITTRGGAFSGGMYQSDMSNEREGFPSPFSSSSSSSRRSLSLVLSLSFPCVVVVVQKGAFFLRRISLFTFFFQFEDTILGRAVVVVLVVLNASRGLRRVDDDDDYDDDDEATPRRRKGVFFADDDDDNDNDDDGPGTTFWNDRTQTLIGDFAIPLCFRRRRRGERRRGGGEAQGGGAQGWNKKKRSPSRSTTTRTR